MPKGNQTMQTKSRRPVGRPRGPRYISANVTMTEAQREFAREYGDGEISRGLRMIVKEKMDATNTEKE